MFLASILLFFSLTTYAFAAEATTATNDNGTANIEISSTGAEARSDDIPFGITGFLRMNKGTSKAYDGATYGYRFPIAGADAFTVIITSTTVIVYIPENVATKLSISADDPLDQKAFTQLVSALDAGASSGGILLEKQTTPYLFTTSTSIEHDGYIYNFAKEVEPGQYYVSITSTSSGQDDTSGALYVNSGFLASASDVMIESAPTGLAAVWEFFGGIDYRPFWVSLRTSLVAMVFVFILGLLAARFTMKINDRAKGILDSIFTIPMVLPPTVCGFLLLVAFGNSTGFGRWLIDHGVVLIFTWPGAVIAAFVVAFPLMYRTARGAFEGLDPNIGDAARTLGWSDMRIFFKLTLPLAWPSIAAGTVLAFARALGEFGATLFVAGNYAGITQTMPLAVYFQWMGGHNAVATFWVVVIILISFLVILFINLYAARTQRYRKSGVDEEPMQVFKDKT